MLSEPQLLQIKGLRDGLLITLSDAPWAAVQAALLTYIDERSEFFHGARVALNVGVHVLHVAEASTLRDELSERGISLWAIVSESGVTETTAQMLGLATRLSKPRPVADPPPAPVGGQNSALWVARTLRSGARVEYDGNVVVLGDVNPGAEVIASGSIVVWGKLRGLVHAGANGDPNAVVCALDLSPAQLRIAGEIALAPAQSSKPYPEIARLKNGKLSAEPWQSS
jgi:septum site-determining protein MinC